jgi:hypothetical protein
MTHAACHHWTVPCSMLVTECVLMVHQPGCAFKHAVHAIWIVPVASDSYRSFTAGSMRPLAAESLLLLLLLPSGAEKVCTVIPKQSWR